MRWWTRWITVWEMGSTWWGSCYTVTDQGAKMLLYPQASFQASRTTWIQRCLRERAYTAAVYLKSVYSDGEVLIRLVASKTRVAPLKRQTIPRLELLGATILARLVNNILSNFKFRVEVYYWTDSYTILCWVKMRSSGSIMSSTEWMRFTNWAVEIVGDFPGQYNPADIPS